MKRLLIFLIFSALIFSQTKNVNFTATEGTWISVDVSPDGKKIVFDLLGHLYVMPINGGKATRITDGTSWNMFPRYSNKSDQILFTSDKEVSNDIWTMNLKDKSSKNFTKTKRPVFQGTWSKDNRHIYATGLNMEVRFPAYQFSMHGTKQEILAAGGRTPVNHFNEHPSNGLIYYVHHDGSLPASGPRVKTYNTKTSEVKTYIERPGGAGAIRLSKDGKKLAYVHMDDKKTVLIVHDLTTKEEIVINETLDYGRFESRGFYGVYSNISWNPKGTEVFVSYGGKIHAINIKTKKDRVIEFEAEVNRDIKETIRYKIDIPEDKSMTQSHRFGVKVGKNVLHEVFADLYLGKKNLTKTAAHESNPVYHAKSKTIYYASWTDKDRGSVWRMDSDGDDKKKLASSMTQYGPIAVSPNGKTIAFIRGAGSMMKGTQLENQRDFELIVLKGKKETKVATIEWSGNRYAKRPPSIRFSPDANYVYYSDYNNDQLRINRVNLEGLDYKHVLTFPFATRAVISPNFEWIAFREYHRTYLSVFEYLGKTQKISAEPKQGVIYRVDQKLDGDYTEFSDDSESVYWTRGSKFMEKSISDVISNSSNVTSKNLSLEYKMDNPTSTIVLKNVRIITMNENKDILENATVVIKNNKIESVGTNVTVPKNAKVYDLNGRTIMPGIFDAHGHYGSPISALNVIEQNLYGLKANLAYGVTTMYDVYGTTQKDFWVQDMLRAGKIDGPRIFSVGDPMFVTKYRSKMHRSIDSMEDALEHVQFNKDHGAPGVKDYSNHERSARTFLADASRQLKMNVVTESFGNFQMNLTQIVDGYTGIEHSMGLEPFYSDVVNLFTASEIGMTPTLVVVYNGPSGQGYFNFTERYWEDDKLLNWFRKDYLLRFRRSAKLWEDDYYWARMAKELKKLFDKGVLLQMGAHGQMMGLGAHWEMELFTHGGFTPHEAIQVATINGYKHQGLDHILGSIEAGKFADIVIMTKNPLENIRNTREIEYVIKNGVVYSGKDASRVYPKAEKAVKMYFKE